MPGVRDAVREVAPLMVQLVATEPPPSPVQTTPNPSSQLVKTPMPAAPVQPQILATPALEPQSAPALPAPPPEPVMVAPAVVQAFVQAVAQPVAQPVVAVPAPSPPPPGPSTAPRKVVSAQAVRYLVEPPVEVPRASRRAGEHGTVWLRVVVSAQGLPTLVSVARSSGHSRLDEQALWAMRQARFKPHTEDGRAVEVEVTAPIEYPLE